MTVVDHNHIMQLRAKLEEALNALHLPTGGYAHGTIHTDDPIYAIDFQELRKQIKDAFTAISATTIHQYDMMDFA